VTVVYDPALIPPARIQETVIRTGSRTASMNVTNGQDPMARPVRMSVTSAAGR